MNDRDPARLSDRQRDCLRLLYANFETKEIAARLGLSPYTVKEHLRDARRILGVSRSIQAARLLVEYERDILGVPPAKRADEESPPADSGSATESGPAAKVVRARYPIGILTRLSLIVVIAVAAVALAGALLVGAEAITRVLRAEQIDLSDHP